MFLVSAWNMNASNIAGFNQINRDKWVAGISARLLPDTRILDIGAGQCRYRPLFSHCDYKAQDFGNYGGTNTGLLKQDWKYGLIDFRCDATDIPVASGSFDAILCTEVLEHVPEPIKVLHEISRILRQGGQAFISAPLGSGLHQQPYHFYGGFTPHFYKHFLTELGFDVISIEPNGRFFRLLLQEMHRGVGIVHLRFHYPRWHPLHWILRFIVSSYVAKWLAQLDDETIVDEFTVGYHVEAIKIR